MSKRKPYTMNGIPASRNADQHPTLHAQMLPKDSPEELEALMAEQQLDNNEGEIGEVTYPDEDAEEEDDVKELNFDEE